jgi:GTP diphosphokinase / guanosine-3',5'-bis(diphosphate) 3'-diphosphatase
MLRQYELVERVKAYDPDADEDLLNRAYVFSMKAHGTQLRASGDPYFSHPIEVAGLLTDMKLDDETIVTAILHDTIEDTVATAEEIEARFGASVARLVDGVTKLSKIEAMSDNERAAENLRKFLLAMSDDIRVLIVKLADRLHNMRTLHHIKDPAKRRRIARETMDIYAPLAERVGMYEFMKEMQTLSFKEIEPEAYASITKRLAQMQEGGGDRIARISSGIKLLLSRAGIEAEVTGREKHPYSIWRKMAERHISFEQLSDVMAFRAIVPEESDIYVALGTIHKRWPMVPGRFKDYVSTPKRNGYQSLHTSVIHTEKVRIEIQIRSQRMHAQAEHGYAAHWAYKVALDSADGPAGWIQDLVEILDHADTPEEVLEHTKLAMYQDRIFAFTPKGELIQLPKGATPIDFAYAIHTSMGDTAVGAKINGRVVPLRTIIENGDQVEILRSKAQEPQAYWMNFAVTGKATAAIRRHIRHKESEEQITLGRKIYEEIVGRIDTKLAKGAIDEAMKRLKIKDEPSLMTAIARQTVTDAQLMNALIPGSTTKIKSKVRAQMEAISIKGLTAGVAYDLALCCHPVPGDRIVGLRRPDEAIEVHVIECSKLADGIDADWLDLAWGDGSDGGTARLNVIVKNEPGALATVASIFGKNEANIINLKMEARDTNFHTFVADLEVDDLPHLMRIIAALRAADPVVQTERV